MKDRVSTYPGRVRMTPVSGQTNVYDLERADQPTEEGTPLNKANLLTDYVASLFGLGSSAVPNDVFSRINTQINSIINNSHYLETGSYVGTGTYGLSKPNSITFNGAPVFVCIMTTLNYPMYMGCFMAHAPYGMVASDNSYSVTTSVSGKTISWYSNRNKNEQLNTNDLTYYYFAITI